MCHELLLGIIGQFDWYLYTQVIQNHLKPEKNVESNAYDFSFSQTHADGPGRVGVTKAPFVNFSVSKISDLV